MKSPQVTSLDYAMTGPKTIFGVPQWSAQESKVYLPNNSKPKSTDANSVPKVFNALPKAKTVAERVVFPSGGFIDDSSSYNSTTVASLSECNNMLVSNHMHQFEGPNDHVMHNGKDADDLYRESSPGFDVLVDDDLAEDEYENEDPYGTTGGGLKGGNVNNYGAQPEADREMFHDPQRYDGYDHMPGQYLTDHSRRSSERIMRGSAYLEVRNDRKGSSSDGIDQSDLRYRLELKKGSGLRSVIHNDYARDNHEERRSSDYQRDSRLASSLTSRLHGRIKDPIRSPMIGSVSDMDGERRRNLSRTSPGRSQIRDRIGARNDRTLRGYGTGNKRLEDGRGDFSGPKRFSELKGDVSIKNRLMSGRESFSLGKRKITGEHEQTDSNLSFEGPKPLSEILKRKKTSKMNAPGSESPENKKTEATESIKTTGINQEEPKSVNSEKKTGPDDTQLSEAPNTDEVDHEEGMENQNLEGYDDGEEYYYEDGGEYDLEEGENAEGEYANEEDGGDDFEKKMEDMCS